MKLKLKLHNRNTYPLEGILIKSSSPKVWLQEIQNMEISLQECEVFPIPSTIANELYGCLVVVKNLKIKDLGKNTLVQNIENKLFIPSNSKITPSIAAEEWHQLFAECPHFLHPEIGLVELSQAIDWSDILGTVKRVAIKITEPSKPVFIPNSIKSIRVEVDEEALLKEIENPLTEEERFEKLPFDMKKLLNGNQREMEKFMAFMEKNPELALKYALPLDSLGTFRGDNYGTFSFGGRSFLENFTNFFSFKNANPNVPKATNIVSKILSIGFVFFVIYLIYSLFSSAPETATESPAVFNNMSATQLSVKFFIAIMAFIIIGLLFTSNFAIKAYSNFKNAIVLLIILLFALYNVVGGLYDDETNIFFSLLIIAMVGIILYRLFNANTTLQKRK